MCSKFITLLYAFFNWNKVSEAFIDLRNAGIEALRNAL